MRYRSLLLFTLTAAWLLGQSALAGWTATGPFGGQAQTITIDPSNPVRLLVGTKNALLYRSEDAGESWQPLGFPSSFSATVDAIIIDPKEPKSYYVGVADDHAMGAENGAGVYKSTDAGERWERLPGMKGRSVFALAIAPHDARMLAAGTREGVYRTTDGGANWRKITPEDNLELQAIMSLAFDPSRPDILYAGTPHLPWKTTNGGLSWQSIHHGMIDDSDVFSIRVDTTRPDRIFASACSGIYRSANGGMLWTKIQGIPRSNRRTHIITQDPQQPDTIYAGTSLGLWKSPDGGVSWRKMCEHAIRSIAFDPTNGQTLYLATDRSGILKSTDGGQTLRPINRGFINRSITQFTMAGTNGREDPPPTLYVSTIYDGDFGGVFKSEDAGWNWTLVADQARLLNQNLLALAVSAADDRLLFAASYDGLLKSTDGGRTWKAANKKTVPVEPAESKQTVKAAKSRSTRARTPVARRKPETKEVTVPFAGARIFTLRTALAGKPWLFAGTSMGLFVSEDNGENWEPRKINDNPALNILRLILPPQGLHRMVAMTSDGVFFSEDQGRSWWLWSLPNKRDRVYDVALHPTDPNLLLAATSQGLLRSTDGGKTWELRGGGLPVAEVTTVVRHPLRAQEIYAMEYGKIYRSQDGGDSWESYDSSGLEHATIQRLVFSPQVPERLFGLSASRGIYVKTLTP